MFTACKTRLAANLACAIAVAALLCDGRAHADDDRPTFTDDIRPILRARCGKCHGAETRKNDLDLTSAAGLRRGGESGPVVDADGLDSSLLWAMVSEGSMPPEDADPLTESELAQLRAWIAAGATMAAAPQTNDQPTHHDALYILRLRCAACHGRQQREGDLDLRSAESLKKGGKSGPAIVAGDAKRSLLLKRVRAGEMPPKARLAAASVKPMTDFEIEVLSRWIDEGAVVADREFDAPAAAPDPLVSDADRAFWAFQSPIQPAVPVLQHRDAVRNPIDAFILHRLEAAELSLSPAAGRRALIRRASFDLHGLPPLPDEVDRFLADKSPDAYDQLIDRLLASPRYGERWGGYWLDLAGYADSEGVQHADPVRPHAWRYRDYVIRALNSDKPYDRFLLEQIAGDDLTDYRQAETISDEIYDNLVATGFLRMTPDGTFSGITGFTPDRLEVVDDVLEVLSSSVMGMTLKCARCHSHKFDPLPQRDYYRLRAVFQGALDEHDWLKPRRQPGPAGKQDRFLPYVTSKERSEVAEHNRRVDAASNLLNDQLAAAEAPLTAAHYREQLAKLPEVIRDDVRRAFAAPSENRTAVQQYLYTSFEKTLTIERAALRKQHSDFDRLAADIEKRVAEQEKQRKPQPLVRALWDRGEPSPTYILRRGDYLNPGQRVTPGAPSVLARQPVAFRDQPPYSGSASTGRRLTLARWLIDDDHPLTARVMVNRIWKEHFGRGIVATLDNFGKAGAAPSHPQLLDWLAVRFVQSGWSIKSMHRLIMTSAAYRQSSQTSDEHLRLDPDNRLWSRAPLRRLDAEALRDTLLSVAGQLEHAPFGPADEIVAHDDGLVVSKPRTPNGGWRRSIYLQKRRTQPVTILDDFDRPRMSPNCIERPESTVAPQALHLLNSRRVHRLAQDFARRVSEQTGGDRQSAILAAHRIALGRPPDELQQAAAQRALDQITSQWRVQLAESEPMESSLDEAARRRAVENYCHALVNSAAFLYID